VDGGLEAGLGRLALRRLKGDGVYAIVASGKPLQRVLGGGAANYHGYLVARFFLGLTPGGLFLDGVEDAHGVAVGHVDGGEYTGRPTNSAAGGDVGHNTAAASLARAAKAVSLIAWVIGGVELCIRKQAFVGSMD
jgi:hypothetical protein